MVQRLFRLLTVGPEALPVTLPQRLFLQPHREYHYSSFSLYNSSRESFSCSLLSAVVSFAEHCQPSYYLHTIRLCQILASSPAARLHWTTVWTTVGSRRIERYAAFRARFA